jgi:ATP-dependent Lhr-like helicase
VEILRSRLEGLGPVTAQTLAEQLGIAPDDALQALTALEVEGFAMRGRFSPGLGAEEWCDRRLLARIHRATLERLRKEIEPVATADLMRFFVQWQRASLRSRARGPQGLEIVLAQLEGFEAPASAWESEILPLRVQGYDPSWLDALCISGKFAWTRGSGAKLIARAPVRATPISITMRDRLGAWDRVRPRESDLDGLSDQARAVHDVFVKRGAVFAQELASATKLSHDDVVTGIAELVARGIVASDSFAGLRALVAPQRGILDRLGASGRWSLVSAGADVASDDAVESVARALLRRWGVVFRRVLDREGGLPPWRDLVRVFRRLEARGEVRGGRFVSVHSGEQFALPEAVGLLRELRRQERRGEVITVSAVDPLALAGIVTPGDRVPALAKNKVSFRDGIPIEEASDTETLAS